MLGLLACLGLAGFLAMRVAASVDAAGLRAVLVVFIAVLGALAVTLAYLLYGYFTLTYAIDRQALTIRWGWSRYVIPLADIYFVGPATEVLERPRTGATMPWPGYYLETYPVDAGVSLRTFATQPLHRQVVICTDQVLYALSPERPVRFMEELVRRRERVMTAPGSAPVAQETAPITPPARRPAAERGSLAARRSPAEQLQTTERLPTLVRGRAGRQPEQAAPPRAADTTGGHAQTSAPGQRLSAPPAILRDWPARVLLALAVALNLAMLAYVVWKLPFLPDRIPLHFNTLGQVDRIGQPREIFILPVVSLVVVVVNALLALSVQRYDAFAARLLLAGPLVTGLVAWVAVYNLL